MSATIPPYSDPRSAPAKAKGRAVHTALTKTERIARDRLFKHLWNGREDHLTAELRAQVPEAWHTLEHDFDVDEPKVKLTITLDASVAKFYQAMGRGYHARINRLLATWAQMKIAGMIEAEAAINARIGRYLETERARLNAPAVDDYLE